MKISKLLSSIPSTIWIQLVSEGVIVFREKVKKTAKETAKLQSLLSRQDKEMERIFRLKKKCKKLLLVNAILKAMKADHEQKM
jgi:hypothetical protein